MAVAVAMDSSVVKLPVVDKEVKRLWITKLSLRCIAAVLSLVVVGCCAGTYFGNPVLLGPAAAALVWSIAEGITLFVRRRTYKGIHPGACVGVDLILWLVLGTMAGLQAFVLFDGNVISGPLDSLYTIAGVCGLVVTALLIALFIIACIETHRRRKGGVPDAAVPYYPDQQQGAFNQHQPVLNPNQQPGAFNPNTPFNPNQQPGAFNPHQPHAPFNPNQQQANQQPSAFIPNSQPTTFTANPYPTTFPPTSPFPAHYAQPQTQTPSPQSTTTQPFGQGTLAPSQPPQWVGNSTPQGQYEMSSSPAPQAARIFNGGPPHATGGFNNAQQQAQHELAGGTPAPGGFTQIDPQQMSQYANKAGSPPPLYEMYVRPTGAEGGGGASHEIGGAR
ncbi:hypothetical protein V501_01831 [Pseudogymnoascus sp. VKM F-4519 (FW-2642)]|nr:hypothetical protein V501_01831 [Pseudogymnoascus sp. VKM F-4519 (FW-2642)]